MGDVDLKALQVKSIAEIRPVLGELQRDQLTELLALEADCNSPRETLTKAIVARLEEIDADNAAPPEQEAAASVKPPEPEAAAPAKPPAHHHPDYSGPLTIEQAEWRNRNLKPAKVAGKK